jgi:starvation-inducible DNA-binding protein
MSTKTIDPFEISLSSVDGKLREKNHEALQPVLTSLIAFGLIVKQLHWNIIGPGFRPIHLHLDEIYEDVLEATDTVAERLSATGSSPSGCVHFIATNTDLKDPEEGFIRDEHVLALACLRILETIGLVRDQLQIIETVDTVSADLLHQILAKLEKQHWMLQAQRV